MTHCKKTKKFFFLLLITSYFNSSAQDFRGTWSGFFRIEEKTGSRPIYPDTYYFSLQLHQEGRAVWGTARITDTTAKGGSDCLCIIKGELDKKGETVISLYPEGYIKTNIPRSQGCYSFAYLQVFYNPKDEHKILTGRWYSPNPPVRFVASNEPNTKPDGSSGGFSLEKKSDKTVVDVDKYFDGLENWVTKVNPGDNSFLLKTIAKKNAKLPADERGDVILKEIILRNPNVTIQLYRNRTAGDDTVSLFLNNRPVLINYKFTDKPEKIYLQLQDTDENDLRIVAENLSSSHANTGTMVLEADGVLYQINLSTTFQQNAEIIFRTKGSKKKL